MTAEAPTIEGRIRGPRSAAIMIDPERVLAQTEAVGAYVARIVNTAFFPDTHRVFYKDDHGLPLDGKQGRAYRLDADNSVATGAAAIMRGSELGLPMMTALWSLYVVGGTPGLYVRSARGLVQGYGHKIRVVEYSSTRCKVRGRRFEDGDDDWQEVIWSLDRAKGANLYPGRERSQWRLNPASMLVARATGEMCNWIGSDVLMGIPFYEELVDLAASEGAPLALPPAPPVMTADEARDARRPDDPEPGQGTRRRRRSSTRTPAALPDRAPDAPPDLNPPSGTVPGDEARPGLASEPMTPDMRTALIIRLREQAGLNVNRKPERAAAYAMMGGWLRRPVTTTENFTRGDVITVLDNLDQAFPRPAEGTQPGTPDDDPGPEEPPDADDEPPDDPPT